MCGVRQRWSIKPRAAPSEEKEIFAALSPIAAPVRHWRRSVREVMDFTRQTVDFFP